MKTAIVTGASSGLGKEFVKRISTEWDIDEIWVIARRENLLNELKKDVSKSIRILPLDLTNNSSFDTYKSWLNEHSPDVKLLINCSGYGKFGSYKDVSVETSLNMIELNCKALVTLTELTLPFMSSNSNIIQIASCAAFQPLCYMNVYAASKAFVLSYSRGLNEELKNRSITVTAVCPSWIKTEFIDVASKSDNDSVKVFKNITTADKVVTKALKDAKHKKDISVFGFFTKGQHLLTKLFPNKIISFFWKRQQKI